MNSRRLLVLASLPLLAACAVNPVTGQSQLALISEQDELQIGSEGAKQVAQQYVRLPDEPLQGYVNGIGRTLAAASHRPTLPYEYTVIDTPMVNAFALPGGHIYVTRGILGMMNSEDELAGVLGHETGHVTARHAVQQISKQRALGALTVLGMIAAGPRAMDRYGEYAQIGLAAAMQGFSRQDEFQADDLGADYAARAGWNPDGARRMLLMLDRLHPAQPDAMQRLFQSHPPPPDRVARALARQPSLPPGSLQRAIRREEYLAKLDGLEYGPSPRAGAVFHGVWYHSGWGLKVPVPKGWAASEENEDALFKAGTPEGSASPAALQLIGLKAQPADDAAISGLLQKIGAQVVGEGRGTLAGHPARRFDLRVPREGAAPLAMRAWFSPRGEDLLVALAYSTVAAALEPAAAAVEKLAPLPEGEAVKLPVERIKILTTAGATTPDALAKARLAAEGEAGAAALRLFNGWEKNEPIPAGARYKVPPPSLIAAVKKAREGGGASPP